MLPLLSDHLMEPQHLARQPALSRSRQEAGHPRPIRAIGLAKRARQHQGTFALPQVAVDLLAVSGNGPLEVQNIVGDLESEPEQIAEPIEPAEIAILAIGGERADPHRVNEAVPGSLLEHEPQVVFGRDCEIVVVYPAKLHGLPFQGLDDHVIDFVEDAHRRHRSEPLAGPAKKAHGERVHGIAGVHGDWNPGAAMHCRRAAPRLASVFDVVVHEKGIMQHFQPRRRGEHVLRAPSKRTRSRDAQGRAQALARAVNEILHEPVQMPLRLPARNALRERVGEHVAIPGKALQEIRRSSDVAGDAGHRGGDVAQALG